jgi:MFS family permease
MAANISQPEDKKAKMSLGLIFLTVFIDLVGFGLIIPVLPTYAQQLHASDAMVGLVIAAYSLMQFLFMPFWGRLSDKVGRKPILLISLTASVIGYILWGFSTALPMLFLARMVAGAGNANIAVAQAYVADVTTAENRTKGMAMIGIAFGLGFVLGPAIGGFAAGLGLQTIGFIAAGFSLVDLILTAVILPEPARRSHAGEERFGNGMGFFLDTLKDKKLSTSLAIFFLSTFAFANMEATLVLLTQQYFNFTPKLNSYLFVYVGVLILLVQGGLVRRMAKKGIEKRMVISGCFLTAIGLLFTPATHTVVGLCVALAFLAVGSGINTPANQSILSKLSPPEKVGGVLGVGQSLSTLGRILGPAIGTAAFGYFGAFSPYAIGAVAMLVAFVFSLKLPTPDKSAPAAQPVETTV